MASSSFSSSFSASSQPPKKYDVFISFRGEDTRSNFTSHLHAALCRHNIETYIDYRLEKGDEVWSSLVKAIEDSTLFLIIFSENYASSTWCLNELTRILECSKDEGCHAIPIFYNIDPSHIRKQTGSYGIAFARHEQSDHQKHVPKWKTILTEAANLSGWDFSSFMNEAELIGVIVKGVLKKLESMEQSFYLDGLIGIHEQIAHVESLMCNESQEVRFIGISGMGGIGKTTIAKALFNKLCLEFESFCFLANVREESEKYGIVHLKNELLSILLEDKESYRGIPDGGSIYVQRRLGRKKVLVVLDDVNDAEQLTYLAGSRHWFGKCSRVIITARHKQLLGNHVDNTYEVKALEFDDALQLFNLKAFKTKCIDKEFEQLSLEFVDYAKGIPLALTVLGSLLCGKGKQVWKSQLEKLKKMPHEKIYRILKLSYDELDDEEKNIFLDVVCFWKGKQVEDIEPTLEAYGYSTTAGLTHLQDKCLLSISYGSVSMHDWLQEMGLEIVRKESLEDAGKRSRLCDANDIYQVLKYNQGSNAIKGISLDTSKMKELKLSPQVFAKMHRLKYLEFYNPNYSERPNMHLPQGLEYFPDELRYLRWDNYPLKTLPLTFSAENLVHLEMPNSGMKKLWQGVQNVVNLKKIDLENSMHLMELPDLSKARNLESLSLSHCVSLCEVHPSIFSLDKLKNLLIRNCVSLTCLKSDSHLRSLCCLSLHGCSNLREFSITSENMSILSLEGTAINELPSCIGQMFKLSQLYLKDCKSLKNIGCNLFGGLKSLDDLGLYGGCNTFEVVHHISMLSSLVSLTIKDGGVECLPASMKHLSSLRYLTLHKCQKLRSVPHLPPSIVELFAVDCTSLETVEFTSAPLQSFMKMNQLYVFYCLQNCLELNERSIKAILANYLFRLDKDFLKIKDCNDLDQNFQILRFLAQVRYPGSRVPEWFQYKATHASITIDLSSAPPSMDWTLFFCVVVSLRLSKEQVGIKCTGNMRFINDQKIGKGDDCADEDNKVDVHLGIHPLASADNMGKLTLENHVCLWWNDELRSIIRRRITDGRVTFNTKISLELNFVCHGSWTQKQHFEIKGCGVCPTYASEYQNFIKELKKESEATASYRNSDEQEIVPPKQSSNNLIFSPFPTLTWKSGTKGLKDIVHP